MKIAAFVTSLVGLAASVTSLALVIAAKKREF